jgi:hypothetical protein
MALMARVFSTTHVNHVAATAILRRALREGGHALQTGEGLFERPMPDGSWQFAVVGSAIEALTRYTDRLGLVLLDSRVFRDDEGWWPVA